MPTEQELERRIDLAREKREGLRRRIKVLGERIKRSLRQLKSKDRKGLPNWLPQHYAELWRKPWLVKAAENAAFRELVWKHGYVSPHFLRAEARCKCGTEVPESLRANCQRQGFNLEKFRHALGDVTLTPLSWYRPQWYNAQIGGASQSRHIQADATDFTVQLVQRIGTAKWDATADRIYANGGRGSYPAGSRHLDSRGYSAEWTSF